MHFGENMFLLRCQKPPVKDPSGHCYATRALEVPGPQQLVATLFGGESAVLLPMSEVQAMLANAHACEARLMHPVGAGVSDAARNGGGNAAGNVPDAPDRAALLRTTAHGDSLHRAPPERGMSYLTYANCIMREAAGIATLELSKPGELWRIALEPVQNTRECTAFGRK